MPEQNQSFYQLPIELRAHVYQKIEELKSFLVPGLEVEVKINPKASEGFNIKYIIKAESFKLESEASGEDPYTTTSEATNILIDKIGTVQAQVIQQLEDNNMIVDQPKVLH